MQAPSWPSLQVVVFDCLDYCATLHNLQAVKDAPNFKVGWCYQRSPVWVAMDLTCVTLQGL